MISTVQRRAAAPVATGPDRTGWAAVAGWAGLIVAVFIWGFMLRRLGLMTEDRLPPLHAAPRLLTWQMLPAAVIGAAGVAGLPMLARRLSWRPLLLTAWLASIAWTVALAASDGVAAFGQPLAAPGEYLPGLGPVLADPLRWVDTFSDELLHYPTHVAGHPPLPMLVLWALHAAGLAGPYWSAAVVIAAGCSAVATIAMTVRAVAGEGAARRALPFLVLAPLAVWIATSMDALFLGVGAWATALLALASTMARRQAVAFAAGGLFGALPYLSYGLLPLLALPLAVLVVTRPRRQVVAALLAGSAIIPVLFTLAGFWWPDGVAATHAAYEITGGSGRRPYLYFLVGNLAVLGLLTGPAVAHALPALVRSRWIRRDRHSLTAETRVGALVAAALLGMAALDLSGITRGEVERIWLPYAAWMLVATALHQPPARRWLAVQALTGVALQALVLSNW